MAVPKRRTSKTRKNKEEPQLILWIDQTMLSVQIVMSQNFHTEFAQTVVNIKAKQFLM